MAEEVDSGLCDLCGKPIIPFEDACYGAWSGPNSVHWDCYVAKNGEPDPFGMKAVREMRAKVDAASKRVEESIADLRKAIKRDA